MKTIEEQVKDAMWYLHPDRANAHQAYHILMDIKWPKKEPVANLTGKQVAIVVGHEPGGGAEGERDYNVRVAQHIGEILKGHDIRAYLYYHSIKAYTARIKEMTSNIKRVNPNNILTVELHYNDVDIPRAEGHEFHYYVNSLLAVSIRDSFQAAFPTSRARHSNGIYRNTDGNGSFFLRSAPGITCLVEPFFHSNPVEWDFFRDREEELAIAYSAGILNYLQT